MRITIKAAQQVAVGRDYFVAVSPVTSALGDYVLISKWHRAPEWPGIREDTSWTSETSNHFFGRDAMKRALRAARTLTRAHFRRRRGVPIIIARNLGWGEGYRRA